MLLAADLSDTMVIGSTHHDCIVPFTATVASKDRKMVLFDE